MKQMSRGEMFARLGTARFEPGEITPPVFIKGEKE